MVIQISRREVLNNLIRFKESLAFRAERKGDAASRKRVYPALINRHTGDLRFAERIDTLDKKLLTLKEGNSADWQEVHFFVEEEEGQKILFQLMDMKDAPISRKDLDPLAYRIAFEMIEALNQLCSLYHKVSGLLPESAALQHLDEIHIGLTRESIENAPGWSGTLTRIEAEKKLSSSPPGTYLIRKGDSLDESVARAMTDANGIPMHVYLLTFVEEKKKISEKLLIQTDRGWTICHDESNLSLYEYQPTLQALFQSISELKTPI